jgi:tRNA pseudouridine55 synthase
LDGILNINKPAGKTSYGVVAIIKRLTGERRVGHAGTLDPDATGVLPISLGKATRVVEYLADAAKTYIADVEFGAATDTYDASGTITQHGDVSGLARAQIEAALAPFQGEINQMPPMYSALKRAGEPLYKLARAGITVERKTRRVTIYHLEITDWQPPVVTLEIECSKGTYIRSIAHDLGQALGCGAFLKTLVRSRYGTFDIKEAISIPQLEAASTEGTWKRFLYPLDYVLEGLPKITISETEEKAMIQGSCLCLQNVDAPDKASEPRRRAYGAGGRFIGILRFVPESGLWRPEKVFVQGT